MSGWKGHLQKALRILLDGSKFHALCQMVLAFLGVVASNYGQIKNRDVRHFSLHEFPDLRRVVGVGHILVADTKYWLLLGRKHLMGEMLNLEFLSVPFFAASCCSPPNKRIKPQNGRPKCHKSLASICCRILTFWCLVLQ